MTYTPGQQVQVRIRDRNGRSRGWRSGEYAGTTLDGHVVDVGAWAGVFPASDVRLPRPKPAKRKAAKRRKVKATDSRWSAYLDFVRSKPCAFADVTQAACEGVTEAHHFPPRGRHSNGHDLKVAPLCVKHHREWHAGLNVLPFTISDTDIYLLQAQVELLVEWLERPSAREGVE